LAEFDAKPPLSIINKTHWNALLDHALERDTSFKMRKDGSRYTALYGYGTNQSGKIAYGGPNDTGGVDGTDFIAVLQAVHTAILNRGMGVVNFAAGTYYPLENDTLSWLASNSYLVAEVGTIIDMSSLDSVNKLITFGNVQNCGMTGFKWLMNSTPVTVNKAIGIDGCTNVSIIRNSFKNPQIAITIQGSSRPDKLLTIRDNYFYSDSEVSGCKAIDGNVVAENSILNISNNGFKNIGYPIRLQGFDSGIIENNWFDTIGNNFGNYIIAVFGGSYKISGNFFLNAKYGVDISTATERCTASFNRFENVEYCFYTVDVDRSIYIGNKAYYKHADILPRMFSLQSCNYTQIINNECIFEHTFGSPRGKGIAKHNLAPFSMQYMLVQGNTFEADVGIELDTDALGVRVINNDLSACTNAIDDTSVDTIYRFNSGLNPYGKITNPFDTSNDLISLNGSASSPSADTSYTARNLDMIITSSLETVVVYDNNDLEVFNENMSLYGFYLPIGFKIKWVDVPSTILVFGT